MNPTSKASIVVSITAGFLGGVVGALIVVSIFRATMAEPPRVAEVMSAVEITTPSVLSNCATEIRSFCARVKPGGGRLKECLMKQESDLTPDCVNQLKNLPISSESR